MISDVGSRPTYAVPILRSVCRLTPKAAGVASGSGRAAKRPDAGRPRERPVESESRCRSGDRAWRKRGIVDARPQWSQRYSGLPYVDVYGTDIRRRR